MHKILVQKVSFSLHPYYDFTTTFAFTSHFAKRLFCHTRDGANILIETEDVQNIFKPDFLLFFSRAWSYRLLLHPPWYHWQLNFEILFLMLVSSKAPIFLDTCGYSFRCSRFQFMCHFRKPRMRELLHFSLWLLSNDVPFWAHICYIGNTFPGNLLLVGYTFLLALSLVGCWRIFSTNSSN